VKGRTIKCLTDSTKVVLVHAKPGLVLKRDFTHAMLSTKTHAPALSLTGELHLLAIPLVLLAGHENGVKAQGD